LLNIHGRYEQLELLCNFTSSKFLHLKNTDKNVNFSEKPWWKACGFKKLFSKPNIIFLSVRMFYTSLSKFSEIRYWTVHHNRIRPWPRGSFTRCTYAFGLCKYNSAHWSYLEKIPRHSWLKQIAWQWWSTTKANTNIQQRKANDGVICLLTKVLVSSQSWPDNVLVSSHLSQDLERFYQHGFWQTYRGLTCSQLSTNKRWKGPMKWLKSIKLVVWKCKCFFRYLLTNFQATSSWM